jgi:hypothetical protein
MGARSAPISFMEDDFSTFNKKWGTVAFPEDMSAG